MDLKVTACMDGSVDRCEQMFIIKKCNSHQAGDVACLRGEHVEVGFPISAVGLIDP